MPLQVSARVLREALYSDGSEFAEAFNHETRRTNATTDKWSHRSGVWERSVSYTAARSVLVAAHRVTEHQRMTVKHDCCVLDAVAHTPDVPFGATFVTKTRCVILPIVLSSQGGQPVAGSRMQMSFEVQWVAPPPRIRGAIVSGARNGILQAFDVYTKVLQRHLQVGPIAAQVC